MIGGGGERIEKGGGRVQGNSAFGVLSWPGKAEMSWILWLSPAKVWQGNFIVYA